VLDDQPILESKDLEADLHHVEVVVGVREDEVAVCEDPHDLDAGRGLGQPLEELRQADVALAGQGVVLNVLAFVDDPDSLGITRFDALEQGTDLFLTSSPTW